MTSALKIKANRANARAGTGPRTRQGKIRSAQNARRHGLSVSVLTDPLLSEEAENLTRALAGEGASAAVLQRARSAAAAQIDLIRIRKARHDLLVRKLEALQHSPETASAIRILELLAHYRTMAIEDKGEHSQQAAPHKIKRGIDREFHANTPRLTATNAVRSRAASLPFAN